jgi:hypothetical protein
MYAAGASRRTILELSKAEQAELRRRVQTVGDEVFKDLFAVKATYENLKAAAAKTQK